MAEVRRSTLTLRTAARRGRPDPHERLLGVERRRRPVLGSLPIGPEDRWFPSVSQLSSTRPRPCCQSVERRDAEV
jgi:hypothetical protein